jgi:hypothetical protein
VHVHVEARFLAGEEEKAETVLAEDGGAHELLYFFGSQGRHLS